MDSLPIPPEYQFYVSAAIGLLAVIGWAYAFLKERRSPSAKSSSLPRAALDAIAFELDNRTRDEVKEIRASLAAANAAEANKIATTTCEHLGTIAVNTGVIADWTKTLPPAIRRRR